MNRSFVLVVFLSVFVSGCEGAQRREERKPAPVVQAKPSPEEQRATYAKAREEWLAKPVEDGDLLALVNAPAKFKDKVLHVSAQYHGTGTLVENEKVGTLFQLKFAPATRLSPVMGFLFPGADYRDRSDFYESLRHGGGVDLLVYVTSTNTETLGFVLDFKAR